MRTVGVAALALLLLTWVVYPAAVIALAALRRRTAAAAPLGDVLPRVTCVLATRDDLATVRERVENFLAQDYPAERLDVVVAVDAAAGARLDELAPLAGARVRVVAGEAPGGKGPALNAGVAAAAGEILVFSDARQRFAPDTVARLVGALRADARLGAASGRLVLPRDAQSAVFQLYWRYERAIRAAEARLHSAVGVSGSVYAMPRACWARMPAGLILDDLWAPMRLVLGGRRIGFVDDALAFETRRVNAGQEFTRKVRTLTGNFQLVAWLPGVLLPLRNPIWAQFVCHKLLRLLTPYAVLALGAWLAWEAWHLAGPRAPLLLALVAVGALWLLAGRDAIARRLRGIATQVASLQAATVVACVNGVRGRWDVWKA